MLLGGLSRICSIHLSRVMLFPVTLLGVPPFASKLTFPGEGLSRSEPSWTMKLAYESFILSLDCSWFAPPQKPWVCFNAITPKGHGWLFA